MITWARIIELFLQLLQQFIEYFKTKERQKEAANAQQEQDKINNNPVEWFNEHFDSRMRAQETNQTSNSDKTSN